MDNISCNGTNLCKVDKKLAGIVTILLLPVGISITKRIHVKIHVS